MSVTRHPKRSSKERKKNRFELKIEPVGKRCGSMSPGMTNSSPVENKATLGLSATVKEDKPMLAAKPNEPGSKRVPLGSSTMSLSMSSPFLRMH